MKAFEHYRKKINTNNNINAKLRLGQIPEDSFILSSALRRASCPDNILDTDALVERKIRICPTKQ